MRGEPKAIRDFVLGKIRRSELEGALDLDPPGPVHPELGLDQGTLRGAGGVVRWGTSGAVLPVDGGERVVLYEAIASIEARPLLVVLASGEGVRPTLAGDVAEVTHATLRWIGRALLRRKLDR